MKKIIIATLIIFSSQLNVFSGESVGLYSKPDQPVESGDVGSYDLGIYRVVEPGTGGGDPNPVPVGEGLLLLAALAGARYAKKIRN